VLNLRIGDGTTMQSELKIRLFAGVPDPELLQPGEAGVNEALLNSVCEKPLPKNRYWASILRAIILHPTANGTTPANEEIAAEVGVSRFTVARAKTNYEKMKLIFRVNLNGSYAYSPKLFVARDGSGNVIVHKKLGGR
jgi:hypothetical protein